MVRSVHRRSNRPLVTLITDPKPQLAVNRSGRTVAQAVNGFVTHAATGFVGGTNLDVATAYFNVGGYLVGG